MNSGSGLNGSGGERPSNITSLEEARRRAEAKRRETARAAGDLRTGPVSTRDWIIGGLVLAMAVAMIGTWIWGFTAPSPAAK